MTKLAIGIDLHRCIGCNTCSIACKMQNNVPDGMLWNRVLTDGEDALTQVCRWYLQHTECPRQSALHRVQYRNDHVAQLVHDFKADGAIYEQMKFCTYWSYERVIANQVMPRDYGIHILSIDRPYIAGQSGQLRTRVQAFVESLEMKQLRSAQKEDN